MKRTVSVAVAVVCSLSLLGAFALPLAGAAAHGMGRQGTMRHRGHRHRMVHKPGNIVQVAASAREFSTLVSLVKKAGLVKALEARGKLTVFAPTNAAFAALKRKKPKLFAEVAHSKKLLAEVLKYHVVKGFYPAKKLVHRRSVRTLLGQRLGITVRMGHVLIKAAGDTAMVVKANIMASNGVIHAINAVLLPKL
jgi:uncharacterized surface protein with fasciclin (FAS1) repeats